jgi:DNA-binding transcriptional ArsR family regulator
MKPHEIQFALNLEALSAPQCRRLVEALNNTPLSQEDLSKVCKLSPASVEKHLTLLKDASLIKVRVKNGERIVQLQSAMLQPTVEWFSKLIR